MRLPNNYKYKEKTKCRKLIFVNTAINSIAVMNLAMVTKRGVKAIQMFHRQN
jgi:hypothetical protein